MADNKIPIEWGKQNLFSNPTGYQLNIHTGVTVGLQNTLTLLQMPLAEEHIDPAYVFLKRPPIVRDPFDRTKRVAIITDGLYITKDLEGLQLEIAKMDRPQNDPIPEMMVYSRDTVAGVLDVVIVWGMVLSGKAPNGDLVGDWYFIICRLDELIRVLEDIFLIDRWFSNVEEAKQPLPKKKATVDEQRAAIERVLAEAGLPR